MIKPGLVLLTVIVLQCSPSVERGDTMKSVFTFVHKSATSGLNRLTCQQQSGSMNNRTTFSLAPDSSVNMDWYIVQCSLGTTLIQISV